MTQSLCNSRGNSLVFLVLLTALVLLPLLPGMLQGKESVASSAEIMETGGATQGNSGFYTNLGKGIAIVVALFVLRKIIAFLGRHIGKQR